MPPLAQNVTIVLNKPKYPENIGSSARAMHNMGLSRLVVVAPANPDPERMERMATHSAVPVLSGMEIADDLETALAPFGYVVGTTARTGRRRRETAPPREMARRVAALAESNRVAVVFGPEDRGLTNAELELCHAYVNIPTADFSSLNLSQAVMVVAYELFQAALGEERAPAERSARLAGRVELSLMYEELAACFRSVGFENPENRGYWVDGFRNLFSRLALGAKEVRMIRAMCSRIESFAEECRRGEGRG